MAKTAAIWFAVFYLRMWYAVHQRDWLDRLRALGEKRGSMSGKRLLLLAPRAHGKTETVISFITQEIAENRNLRVLLLSKAKEGARKRLRRIKANLEGNPRLIQDYGRFKPQKLPPHLHGFFEPEDYQGDGATTVQVGYWTENYLYVERTSDKTDPTLEAVGWRGSILGGRFDLIVCDDPIDTKLAQSETERKKAKEWFYDTVLELLEPNGRIVAIGTRKHHDDLYQTLIDDPTFQVQHDSGIVDWPQPDPETGQAFEGVYSRDEHGRQILEDIRVGPGGKVLWAEKWPMKSLLAKLLAVRATVGARVFLREIQNIVTDNDASQFPMEFFEGGEWAPSPDMPTIFLPGCYDRERSWMHEPLGLEPDGETISPPYPDGVQPHHLGLRTARIMTFQMWDLSLVVDKDRAESRDTDYTVGKTIAIDLNTWTRYHVSHWRRRGLKPNDILDAMWSEYWRFGGPNKVYRVAIESVLFQAVYELLMRDETDVPVIGHSTSRGEKADSYKGIPYLSALCQNGKARWPYRTHQDQEITAVEVKELHQWPDSAHDDTVLSWFVGEQIIAKYQRRVMHAERLRSRGRVSTERPEEDRL